MRSVANVLALFVLASGVQAEDRGKSWDIHGQVVDERGVPVEDFKAATVWSSNGKYWGEAGVVSPKAPDYVWKREGVLAARPSRLAEKLPEGKFCLTIKDRSRASVFVVDKRQQRGGIVLVEKKVACRPVSITLAPLVRVTAEIYCSEAGRTPDWSLAQVFPIGGDNIPLTQCGTFRGKVSFLLPAGQYDFYAYSESPAAKLHVPKKQISNDATSELPVRGVRVEVPRGRATFDIGVLNLALPHDKDSIPRDITQFYGRKPPELDITDARGVSKDVKLADFHGKWVLLDFWATWCGPCVVHNLPELSTFYEEHAADRDRFEILAICNTEKEEARTIKDFDVLAAPIVKNVWSGKQLPFPVLVDGEGRTFGVYGIQQYPTVLLIDPQGHLVKDGDMAMLADRLKENKN